MGMHNSSKRKSIFARLHPRAGRKLPPELRPENVGRLAGLLALGVRDPGFELLVGRIETGTIHRGNKVRLFFQGADAFASVGQAIHDARSEVLLETYILRDDATGRNFRDWLADAVGRGVKACVLADAYGSWNTKRSFWRGMKKLGIEARLFHPVWSHLGRVLFRDHRKITVIDRRVAFTGGMNVGNEYGSARRSRNQPWRDTHIRIEGTAARELALVFNESWVRAGGRSLKLPEQDEAGESGVPIQVLDSRSGRGHDETASVLAALAGAAKQQLWITNSYFAPDHTVVNLLRQAAQRGVDVRILLQGRTDMPLVRNAGRGNYAELLAGGVRIYEYQPEILHAKTIVVDGYASVVGSTNLDFRSFYFNAECNVLVFDGDTGGEMAAKFEEDLGRSVEMDLKTWNKRPLVCRLGYALARFCSPLL